MPTYNFSCENCGYKQQKLVSILYSKKSKCPKCQKYSLIRLIGKGCGFKLNGKDFYKKGWNIK